VVPKTELDLRGPYNREPNLEQGASFVREGAHVEEETRLELL
jgi:hypothetical protein